MNNEVQKQVNPNHKKVSVETPLTLNRQRFPQISPRDFRTPLDELNKLDHDRAEVADVPFFRKFVIISVAILAVVGLLFLKKDNIEYFSRNPWVNFYSLLILFYVAFRYALSFLAEHEQKVKREKALLEHPRPPLPTKTVSIIIVGRNEEQAIYKTIENCFNIWYPRHLYEVIAVDDGSTDKTYEEMKKAKQVHERLKIVRFEEGKGKKYGMAEGVRMAVGEIVVFVDSDSFLQPDSISKIIEPFSDEKVAAVSGRSDVENWKTNLLTKMQSFRYFVAFQYMKAAENYCSSVTCCPGCFSAYRQEIIEGVLDKWLHQKFLGKETTYGDDRSLTTIMLRKGYKVLFQDTAICTTLVPEDYSTYLRQQVRWKKSWIRETLIASAFMWKRKPLASISFYLSAIFPVATPFITFYNLVYQPIWNHVMPSYYFLGLLVICVLFSCFYAAKRRDGLWIHGFIYSILYAVLLVWQMPYAFLTLRKTNWGTR